MSAFLVLFLYFTAFQLPKANFRIADKRVGCPRKTSSEAKGGDTERNKNKYLSEKKSIKVSSNLCLF